MDTRLDYMDHASYLGLRAMGHQPMLHYTWVYDRPVNMDALRQLNERLQHGRLSRLVEPARWWGGRHRWVRPEGVPPIEVEETPRPRTEIQQWSLEVSRRPIDPRDGPTWRFGVLSLDDGGSAIAMVVSHTITDGAALVLAIEEAMRGERLDQPYPRRGEHRPRRRDELRDLIGSIPEKVRALASLIRQTRADRELPHHESKPSLPAKVSTATGSMPRPTPAPERDGAARIVTFVDSTAWKASADRLGGTSNVLAMSVAARIGQRLGRVQQDGRVNLTIAVSIRDGDDDLRGNALSSVVVTLDPDEVVEDLVPARATVKAALTSHEARQLPVLAGLPLTPLVPVWLLRRLEKFALGADVNSVGCSNLGPLADAMWVIDGAPCQYAWGQFNEPGRPTAELARMGGQGFLGVTTAGDRVVLNVVAFREGDDNSDKALLRLVHEVMADFDLGDPLPW